MGAILVFGNVSFVKTERLLERVGVHLADVDTTIARLGEHIDPTVTPDFVVTKNTVGMRIDAAE